MIRSIPFIGSTTARGVTMGCAGGFKVWDTTAIEIGNDALSGATELAITVKIHHI